VFAKPVQWAKQMGGKFHRLNIGPRLALCFVLIILAMLLGNAVLLWQFHRIRAQADRLSDVDQMLIAVLQAHTNLMSLYERLDALAHSEDTGRLLEEVEALHNALVENNRRSLTALSRLPPELQLDPALLPTLKAIQDALPAHLEALKVLAKSRDWEAVRLRLANQVRPLESRSSALVENVDREVGKERAQAVLNIQQAQRRIYLIVPITAVLTLLFSALLGLAITRSITQPLGRLMEGSTALARGDFSHRVASGEDEIGRLGSVFNDMIVRLQGLYRELQRRESYLAEAQRLSHTGSFGWDVTSGEIYWSEETFRIFELEPASTVTIERIVQRTHPEDRLAVQELITRVTRKRAEFNVEHRLLMPDGRVKHLQVVGHPSTDELGRFEFVGAVTDISEAKVAQAARKHAEDEVRAAKARFEGILEIADDAIISVDSNQRILLFNRGAEKVFGHMQTDVIGKPLGLLLPQHLEDVHRKHIEDFARSPDVARTMGQRREVYGRRSDRREFPAEASISKLDLGGKVIFTVILRDITERKRAEQRLVAQHTVTRVLAEANTLEEATPKVLGALCECLVWDVGELWRVDRAAGVLRCVEIWHKESIEAPQFVATSRDRTFMPGSGLPGRVWSSREPAYIPDVIQDSSFLRASIAAGAALHAAFAFPILLGSEVVGVMDFFSQEIREPDQDLLDLMSSIGSQIGQFIERKRAEEELRRSEAYLAEAQRLSLTGSFGWRISSGEILWSEETFRIFEYDRATCKPTVDLVLQRVYPEDIPLIQQAIDHASTGNDFDLEHRLLMPDASIKHVRFVGRPSKADKSGDGQFVGAMTDITERKRAEADLQNALHEIKKLKDQLDKENIALREEIDKASMFEDIVGESPALQAVLARVAKVAPTESSVLITGETGTGKELIARAIHKRSQRSSRAFVSVNCAAIPATLIASELFGHEKGAFTGALQRRLGRFELAEGGTIFLDEIGELPAETQIALLRVLQEREFERLGGSQPIRADVRVIAATNRDLESAITLSAFRRDLFYRLNVFPIEIPPLRKRREDISTLIEYFIHRYSRKAGKKIGTIEKRTLELLESYEWPGNIRELQNVIERSVIVCETDIFSVDPRWLSPESPSPQQDEQPILKRSPAQEKETIERALAATGGRISGPSGAAARLNMPPSTLESKIRALKINKFRFKNV
jgi:PAS domain S-box-containing protein